MPVPESITANQLMRRLGLPDAPVIIDVRTDDDFALDPRKLPTSIRRDALSVASWASDFAGCDVVVVCQKGLKLSQGVAAWLRHVGARAEVLDGGFLAWATLGGALVRPDHVPAPGPNGATVWVTRARPKIDRIACPWLIRRFIDPKAVFLFVGASEVQAVADRFHATPFDIDAVFWSHRGDRCTFDVMLQEFGLASFAPLASLAVIVRGADTARLDLAPQSAGLLAASLGFSRLHRSDLAQLDAAMSLYDAFYMWCRDAVAETHDWPGTAASPRLSAPG